MLTVPPTEAVTAVNLIAALAFKNDSIWVIIPTHSFSRTTKKVDVSEENRIQSRHLKLVHN